jgi:hypothetical protein
VIAHRARRRRILLAAVGALALLGALASGGCSPKSVTGANVPPETYLFLDAPVDSIRPTSHRVHLYWYGTDPDGDITGFEFRMIAPGGVTDPPWVRLPASTTDSMFTVFTGDSAQVTPTFEFRSVDDDGAVDGSPARQTFRLNNLAPVVTITDPMRTIDSTYASVTIHWTVDDPDGGGPGLRYRLWLDGNEANMDSTPAQTFTVPSHRFLQPGPSGPRYVSGPRTLSIQAVDDGGRSGPVTTTTWFVRAPAAMQRNTRGRVLLIDDVPSAGQNNASFDAFYAGGLAGVSTRLLADSGSVLRTQFNPGIFRSASDFAQTLRQFETVVWYRGFELGTSSLIQSYQDSLLAWLDTGGRLYLDGLYLILGTRTPGSLREDVVQSHLGSYRLSLAFNSSINDSCAGWSNSNTSRFRSSRYAGQMTTPLPVPGLPHPETPGIRVFQVRDTSHVALWALPGQLAPPNDGFEAAVGVSVPYASGGRWVLVSFPMRTSPPAQSSPLFLNMVRDVLRDVAPPAP